MKILSRNIRNNIFLLLVFIVIPFRLYHLNYPILDAHSFRQTQTATIALNFYKSGINLFKTELDIFGIGKERFLTLEFPLYEAIVTILYKLFFVSEKFGRFISIVSGILGAWYLFKLVKLLTSSNKIVLLSSLFFLFAPLNMFYQRSFMIESFIVFLLLAGVYYFCHFVNFQDKKSYLLAIILLSLGFIQKGMYGPFWLLPLIWYYKKKYSFAKILSPKFIFLIVLPLLTLFLWIRHMDYINFQNGHEYFTTFSKDLLSWNMGTLSDRFSISEWGFRLKNILNGIFLKPGIVIFLIGILSAAKVNNNRFFYLWFISEIIYFSIFFRIQSHNYYQMVMIPAISFFMATGLVEIGNWIKNLSNKLNFKKYLKAQMGSIFIAVFCALFIWKSWINSMPFFYIDWDWYRRLRVVGQFLSNYSYGILVTPGYDWNSAYTYIPRKKMLLVTPEELTPEHISAWQKEGYSFIIFHEPEKYKDYLTNIKSKYTLDLLYRYNKILSLQEFEVYTLK